MIALYFFFIFPLFASEVVFEHDCVQTAAVCRIIPEQCNPTKIILSAKGLIDRDEIKTLCRLDEKKTVYRNDLINGLSYCAKKKQFECIFLSWNTTTQELHLHFVLHYRIKKIQISGIAYDIETYRQLYGAEKYEVFDQIKHQKRVQCLIDYLHEIGYWDAKVTDKIQYDEKTRHVTVCLELHFGVCYTVDHCTLTLDQQLEVHKNKLASLFYKRVQQHIQHKSYQQTHLNTTLADFSKKLYQSGFFCQGISLTEEINTDNKTVSLQFALTTAYPYQIIVEGNTFFNRITLYEKLAAALRDKQSISATHIRQALQDIYVKSGFLEVDITEQDHTEITVFSLYEGSQFFIKTIQLTFIDSIEEKYKQPCQLHLTKNLLLQAACQEDIEKAIETMLLLLKNNGFFDAQLIQYTIEKKSKNSISIRIYLEAKEQKHIESSVVASKDPLPFLPSLNLCQTEVLTPHILTHQRETLERALQQQGYLHATIVPEIKEKTLIWHIEAHEQKTMGKIIIQGNPELSISRIKQFINLPEHTYWQQHKIQESIQLLQKLGIYERVELYADTTKIDHFHPVILNLIPDNPCELRLRLGGELQHMQDYQSFDGISYKAGCSFIVKNMVHLADKLQCDIDFAKTHREIITSWIFPFAFHHNFDLPLSALWHAKAQGYYIRFDNPGAIGYPKNIYTIGRDGFLINIGNIKDNSYFNFNLGFEQQKTSILDQKNALELAKALNFDPQELSKPIPYGLIDLNFLLNFLNDGVYPTQGASTLCGIKMMVPIHDSSTYYIKCMFQQSLFFSIFDVIFALRARFGYLFHKDFSKINPAERFYLGGSHSVRGYEADYFPPISPFVDSSGRETIVPRGGKIMVNTNIELTRNIWSLVSLAVFHDMGALADDIDTMTAMVPLQTSGFGLRIETPFGPLRFDIGWKWHKIALEERNYAWYISFGRSF